MLLRVGHRITIRTQQDTPLICMVTPHVSRHDDYTAPEKMQTDPQVPVHSYFDAYGNICRRLVAPAGLFTLSSDITLRDDGARDPVDYAAEEWQVEALPDEALKFLVSSRYVESDLISQEAWDRFGAVPAGWQRVQAVVDHVHSHLRFDYQNASATRTAMNANYEGVGVCRDFAHLALAYLRALNIPARYVNGYLGDIGIPPVDDPMDFCAWIEVFLGGRWWTFDPRNNQRRIGRVVIARGHDAADVPLMNSFGQHYLEDFTVWCHPVDQQGNELDGMLFA
ncbi:transglutaminase family protein [Paracoccus caeni]|uniref:Transglutaminase family protein n=1 Tax=Paracoccus caeni TaxID=657651 RepID=A0A934SK98_9RHOB|nr:transglutaminase family protein [Paracoccus caeni]MBK4215953.1 transglutaminase family protein [Paracoccus caeni]